ncbi:YARHG domain-containing protein [Dichotomicrobium thermohalophilum]|nr:YARHG domain-containing protein [Dichotomicrobium thermohalophilum]
MAQDTDEQGVPDPGGSDQMEMMDEQGTGDAVMDEQDMEEPVDPASPEADGMDGTMMDEQDMGEPDADAMQEETGPADMISDSSERALVEEELVEMTCDELWIARNEIFDRNGYCFRSERGKAYFDNSDCTSDSQDILSELEWQNVELIKQVEAEKQCN